MQDKEGEVHMLVQRKFQECMTPGDASVRFRGRRKTIKNPDNGSLDFPFVVHPRDPTHT